MSAKRPHSLLICLLGVLGGVAGIVGSMYEEMRLGGFGLLVIVLIGPAIEEIMKPIGVVFMLDKRPNWLRSGREVALLAILGSLVFATLENIMYVAVREPDLGADYVVFRFTVCTALHLVATSVFGMGLAKMWRHIRREGGHFDIDVCFRYYVAAVVIHAAYNSVALILEATGALRFGESG